MLYIVLNINGTYHERTWHTGEHLKMSDEHINAVMLVQADCDELLSIRGTFPKLYLHDGPVNSVKWFGDQAKFIVANLCCKKA